MERMRHVLPRGEKSAHGVCENWWYQKSLTIATSKYFMLQPRLLWSSNREYLNRSGDQIIRPFCIGTSNYHFQPHIRPGHQKCQISTACSSSGKFLNLSFISNWKLNNFCCSNFKLNEVRVWWFIYLKNSTWIKLEILQIL